MEAIGDTMMKADTPSARWEDSACAGHARELTVHGSPDLGAPPHAIYFHILSGRAGQCVCVALCEMSAVALLVPWEGTTLGWDCVEGRVCLWSPHPLLYSGSQSSFGDL